MKIISYISILLFSSFTVTQKITISLEQATEIGYKIWHNECKQSIDKLTWWNDGEEFASLGIGHFIWLPAHYHGIFDETFPALITFFRNHHVPLPKWLLQHSHCPWDNKKIFFQDFRSSRMEELRKLLSSTIALQTLFIIERFIQTLPSMLNGLSAKERNHVNKQVYRIAQSSKGLYALIDYLNFKGTGTNTKEQYNGQGWGLLQVLLCMQETEIGDTALIEFSQKAEKLLIQRINNAPKERNEQRWLSGWKNRLSTYNA